MMRIVLLCILLSLKLVSGAYVPLREYSGQNFFSGWDYYGNVDNTTWGNVSFVDQNTANTQQLTFVDPNSGHAFIRVDNTTNIQPATLVNRNTIKITSTDAYPIGSLIIMDAVHIPHGCSVWPSFWTLGIDFTWPHGGEIDIVEGINTFNTNQMALHSDLGCFQAANNGQTGRTINGDCSTDQGCLVQEMKNNSFGESFARAGGGVFATQIDISGIYIWFWGRSSIPASISQATSNSSLSSLSDWGPPTASYPATGCDISRFFTPQKLVIDITLCGLWAGIPDIYAQSCSGTCISQVTGNGSNYALAYWEISYIRTYLASSTGTLPVSPSGTTSSSVPTSTTIPPPSETPTILPSSAAATVGVTVPVFTLLLFVFSLTIISM